MKRDWDQIRTILSELEKQDDLFRPYIPDGLAAPSRSISSEDEAKFFAFYEQVRLLMEAGLVEAVMLGIYQGDSRPTISFTTHAPYRLTWAGHEFLDSIRDAGTWSKIKSVSLEKGSSLTFDVIKELGMSLLKGSVGLPL